MNWKTIWSTAVVLGMAGACVACSEERSQKAIAEVTIESAAYDDDDGSAEPVTTRMTFEYDEEWLDGVKLARNGEPAARVSFTYEDDLITEITRVDEEDGEKEELTLEYDGDLLIEIRESEDGEPDGTTEYSYDEDGLLESELREHLDIGSKRERRYDLDDEGRLAKVDVSYTYVDALSGQSSTTTHVEELRWNDDQQLEDIEYEESDEQRSIRFSYEDDRIDEIESESVYPNYGSSTERCTFSYNDDDLIEEVRCSTTGSDGIEEDQQTWKFEYADHDTVDLSFTPPGDGGAFFDMTGTPFATIDPRALDLW